MNSDTDALPVEDVGYVGLTINDASFLAGIPPDVLDEWLRAHRRRRIRGTTLPTPRLASLIFGRELRAFIARPRVSTGWPCTADLLTRIGLASTDLSNLALLRVLDTVRERVACTRVARDVATVLAEVGMPTAPRRLCQRVRRLLAMAGYVEVGKRVPGLDPVGPAAARLRGLLRLAAGQ